MINFTNLLDDISKDFINEGISIEHPGFYDDPLFMKVERERPIYLNNYARYVQLKEYDDDYLILCEAKFKLICDILHDELVKDGRIGACIDLSMVLGRILEKVGIWNYVVKGALTIRFPSSTAIPDVYFWPIDTNEDSSAGHVWVSAPPFNVIDLTIGMQPFSTKKRKFIPDVIIEKAINPIEIEFSDICSNEVSYQVMMEGDECTIDTVYRINPVLESFFQTFPASNYNINGTEFKYIPCAIGQSDKPLEEITSLELSNMTGYEVYRDKIVPALARLEN